VINDGIKNILFATIFFGFINALVKYFSHIPSIEIVFFRSVVTLVLSLSVLLKEDIKIFNQHTPLLLLRGLTGAIALSLYFYTIQKMPIATAVTILYLAPIFTVILAGFINKEPPNRKQWPFIIIGFLGAVLMKNFDPRASLVHFAMGVAAAFFAGLAYNIIRKLRDKAHHQLIIFYFPLVTIPICIPFLLNEWITPNLYELMGLISIGICTQIAQVFMTKAYMLEKASKISHFNYLTCVYALFTGIIFFNESLNWISLVGMLLILISVTFSSRFSN
jgi:drug/metabolite transporter (DMT)-like permease